MAASDLEVYLYYELKRVQDLMAERPRSTKQRVAREARVSSIVATALEHRPAADAARRCGKPFPRLPDQESWRPIKTASHTFS